MTKLTVNSKFDTDAGNRLRMAREARKVTQPELGKYLGKSGRTIGRWESGHPPSQGDWRLLAHRLGVTARWLLTGEGDMETKEALSNSAHEGPPTGGTSVGTDASINEKRLEPVRCLQDRIAGMKTPARKVLEDLLEDSYKRIKQNQDLSDNDVARLIQLMQDIYYQED